MEYPLEKNKAVINRNSLSTIKTNWVIDPVHSEVLFRAKHLMLTTITGYFTSFSLEAETTDRFITISKIVFNADVNSIITNNWERDQHLKSVDFFDAGRYTCIKFTGNKLEQSGAEWPRTPITPYRKNYLLYGNLTIKNITRPIVLDVIFEGIVVDDEGQTRAGFSVSGKLSREDFNLKWNSILETGKILLSDEITIHCQIQLIKQE